MHTTLPSSPNAADGGVVVLGLPPENAQSQIQPSPGEPFLSSPRACDDAGKLREQLRLSEEWNARLQSQIQQLLKLPYNEIEAMRERMLQPDIAIPLLQCYDATIQEKSVEVEHLLTENLRLRAQVEADASKQLELKNGVNIAEDLVAHIRKKYEDEAQDYRTSARRMQEECNRLRQELTRALDEQNAVKLAAERGKKEAAEMKAMLDSLKQDYARQEESLREAHKRLEVCDYAGSEAQVDSEMRHIQLELLTKGNDDKLAELELVRQRMMQVLRQTSENHSAHLRLVEERHRVVVEEYRELQRTQELEIQKLRAQLTRVDKGKDLPSSSLRSTRELLEVQTRRAQEAELARLYGEVSSIQMQRDDAVQRYEQLVQIKRREADEASQRQRQQGDVLRRQLEEVQQAHQRSQGELATVRMNLRQAQEDIRGLRLELDAAAADRDTLKERLGGSQEQIAALKEKLSHSQVEERSAIELERRRVEALEQRVADNLRELQSAREDIRREATQAQQQRDHCRAQVQEEQQKLQAAKVALQAVTQERDQQRIQLSRLKESLDQHKQQLASCDDRIGQLQGQLIDAEQQQKNLLLSLERLTLENARIVRSRDRVLENLQRTRML